MTPYLLTAPRHTLATLERLWSLLPASRVDERLADDRFTPREVLAHLADWEPIFRSRIEKGAAQPGTTFEVFDESERAVLGKYAEKDPDASLRLFAAERGRTLALLGTLTEEQLEHVVDHPEQGPLRVRDLVQMLSGHDTYHLDQISAHVVPKSTGTW